MTTVPAEPPTPTVVRVFISCPGDIASVRTVVAAALEALNADPAWQGRVRLVPYAYENMAPARSGMDAQDIINSYMLRPEDADLFICLFCRRMGTPMQRFINPDTNQPYQSGTEYEYLRAYAAALTQSAPINLLYRCQYPSLPPAPTEEDRQQLARVDAFFGRFGPGGDLKGLYGTFADEADLAVLLRRDIARVLESDLLPLLVRRSRVRTGPVVFGLPPLPAGYVERSEALDAVRKALLGSRPTVGVVAATALHGLGGLGKTVLARAVCDDPTVRAAFPDGILWATLGQQPDLPRLQRDWIQALGGDFITASSRESGRSELARLISDRAQLLILDDVWSAETAQWLEVTGPHCRVLMTTRFASQAAGATLVSLEFMRPEEARAVLQYAARGHVNDTATSSAIVERLGYLPLSLQVVGALLAMGIAWPEIAHALDAGDLPEVSAGERSLFAVLSTSVRFLPDQQQQRYRELAIFPADEPLVEAAVARLWGRTGGLHTFGARRLLAEFRDRALVQASNTLHDLQVDFLRAVVPEDERRRLHGMLCDSYGDPATWSQLPDDDEGYAWRHLAWHLHEAGRQADLEHLVADGTYLEGKLARLGVSAVVDDVDLSPTAPAMQALSIVMRAGAVVLSVKPDELANQVRGRVGDIPELHHLPVVSPSFHLQSVSLAPADPALERTFSGHTSPVNGCAFSPDGRLALSASSDSSMRLWEVDSGECLHTFTGHSRDVNGCAFSPDGRLALSASRDRTLRLWDVGSGETIHVFRGHDSGVYTCTFSPDGHLALSASDDRTVRLWEVASGESRHTLAGHTELVRGCAFSPDGRLVLSASDDGTLRLWEVESGQTMRTFVGHTSAVNGCAFSPDGRLALSASDDGTLQLWEVASGEPVRTFGGQTGSVYGCAFSPDGRLALSATSYRTLQLWEVASGEPVRTFRGHSRDVTACAFSPDGRLALSASRDRTLRLWAVDSGESPYAFRGHTSPVYECAFSPDGRLALSASDDRTVRLWKVETHESVRAFRGHTGAVRGCAFSPDGRLALSASRDRTLRLWQVDSGESVRTFRGHTSPVNACAFSPDGRLILSASNDRTLRLWQVDSGECLRTLAGHTELVRGCAFSPDGRLILSASDDRTVRLWQVASGESVRTFRGHTSPVNACAFSPDGRLALSASDDRTVRLWEVASGESRHTLAGHTELVRGCAFSPDGRLALSVSDDHTLRLWDITSGREITSWLTEVGLYACAVNPDGHHVMAVDRIGGVHFLEVVGGLSADAQHVEPAVNQHDTAMPGPLPARLGTPPSEGDSHKEPRRKGWWPFGRR